MIKDYKFLETIMRECIDEVHEALIESEHDHGKTIDYPLLNKKLHSLWNAYSLAGLSLPQFQSAIKNVLTSHISHIDLMNSKST